MTVTNEQAWNVVRQAVFTVLSISATQLAEDTRLVDDLGVDSLALVELIEVSEEQLRAVGISVWVDDDTLSQLASLGDLIAALQHAKEK